MILDTTPIFETRLLIFIEVSPQSNKYQQIVLNNEQFNAVSATLGKCFNGITLPNGLTQAVMKRTAEEFSLPDLPSFVTS